MRRTAVTSYIYELLGNDSGKREYDICRSLVGKGQVQHFVFEQDMIRIYLGIRDMNSAFVLPLIHSCPLQALCLQRRRSQDAERRTTNPPDGPTTREIVGICFSALTPLNSVLVISAAELLSFCRRLWNFSVMRDEAHTLF